MNQYPNNPTIINGKYDWTLKILPKDYIVFQATITFPDIKIETRVGVRWNNSTGPQNPNNTYIYDEQKIVSDFSSYNPTTTKIMIYPTKDSQSGYYQTSFKVIVKGDKKIADSTYIQRIFIIVLTAAGLLNSNNNKTEVYKIEKFTNSTSNFTV